VVVLVWLVELCFVLQKTLPRPLRVSNLRNSCRSVASLKPTPPKPTNPPPVVTFCRQVSTQQFEQQKCTGSQKALQELLELMINDKKMKPKDKEKRLLMVFITKITSFIAIASFAFECEVRFFANLILSEVKN